MIRLKRKSGSELNDLDLEIKRTFNYANELVKREQNVRKKIKNKNNPEWMKLIEKRGSFSPENLRKTVYMYRADIILESHCFPWKYRVFIIDVLCPGIAVSLRKGRCGKYTLCCSGVYMGNVWVPDRANLFMKISAETGKFAR